MLESILESDWSEVEASTWQAAIDEARCLELGTDTAAETIGSAITGLKRDFHDTIPIGGPPCQAYSLVGRARARGKRDYVPKDDERHYLFREYIRVLDRLRPAAFVVENVKGMLSSTFENCLVFEMLMEDLSSLGTGHGHVYEIRAIGVEDGKASLQEAEHRSDFVVRTEEFGIPQRRHRVIIVGIRSDLASGASKACIDVSGTERTEPMPSKTLRLCTVVSAEAATVQKHGGKRWSSPQSFSPASTEASTTRRSEPNSPHWRKTRRVDRCLREPRAALPPGYGTASDDLLRWLERSELRAIAQHETRGHMASDLGRYMFAAVFGDRRGYSLKAADFPLVLSPDHRNWHSGVFNDRFRVQLADKPTTTVTSHISKDGHYFIHPDAAQCRSLTVREAARLQIFTDDYLLLGNRTQQYVQVGNAVPPLLARQIARLLLNAVG